jgi:hypothetical protein
LSRLSEKIKRIQKRGLSNAVRPNEHIEPVKGLVYGGEATKPMD